MKLAVASGKGGTGKTTMSIALATLLRDMGKTVCIQDCDVEEPNVNLFLKTPLTEKREVHVLVPKVNEDLCTACGKCERICQFNAIVLVGEAPLTFPDMCHSCGGCFAVCPERAIEEVPRPIGIIEKGSSGIDYTGGLLNIGEAMSPPLIKKVKEESCAGDVLVVDSPPGTSCPVIEAVRDSDYTILVTEPTPFGLNDLKLAVEMARELSLNFGVIINRADSGDQGVVEYCNREGIPLLAEIPTSRRVAEHYSRGDFVSVLLEEYGPILRHALEKTGALEVA